MRRRLTIAILLLVAATLVVTSIGSYVLIQRAAISSGQEELAGQARAVSVALSGTTYRTRAAFNREQKVITQTGAFDSIDLVALQPDGSITGPQLPPGITAAQLHLPRLREGLQTTGHTSSLLAYSAVPTPLSAVTGFLPVLVVTRQIHNPANGFRYFILVGAIGLAMAAVVAAALARRFSRPLVAAVNVTRRIASGDLDATVPKAAHQDPEFTQLADSINVMGANLVRAREQERQFLLSVSHELRTPLTSIRGYADAVLDGATDDPSAAAAVISTEASRMERLVQDLLDLARLDADRFSLRTQPVDCAQIVAQVVDGFRPRAVQLGLELIAMSASAVPVWVSADPDRLGQIVANLVENAASFAAGRVTVDASTVAGRPAVWVTDDGPGIPADQLSEVFERHFVSDRVPGRRKGSGLGLAIVSELAAAMGATVEVESPVAGGRGTTMVVWFTPAVEPSDAPVTDSTELLGSRGAGTPAGSGDG
jgi:signal transduction histidine kinase